jgi:hypothetical protein
MSWWGTFDIPEGRAGRFRIGPIDLWAERRRAEWRIGFDRSTDPYDSTMSIDVPCQPIDLLTMKHVFRYAVGASDIRLTVSARLADRAVVSRPETPVVIPPGEETILYVGSPVWIALASGSAPGKPLLEIPAHRPPDTWFGPTNLEGELCYASRGFWRTEAEELIFRPHRAATRVSIQNEAPTALLAERINLPVPRLRLWCSKEGRLWTDDLTFVRTADDEFATLRLDSKAHTNFQAEGARKLADPRIAATSNIVLRAFNSLFG